MTTELEKLESEIRWKRVNITAGVIVMFAIVLFLVIEGLQLERASVPTASARVPVTIGLALCMATDFILEVMTAAVVLLAAHKLRRLRQAHKELLTAADHPSA